jgi:hypothetical protein
MHTHTALHYDLLAYAYRRDFGDEAYDVITSPNHRGLLHPAFPLHPTLIQTQTPDIPSASFSQTELGTPSPCTLSYRQATVW